MLKPPIKMKFLIILILTITITGETMSHVKGHFDVPAQKTNKNEVKNSFFNSFKKKIFGETKKVPVSTTGGYDGIKIKVFNKGGKVGN